MSIVLVVCALIISTLLAVFKARTALILAVFFIPWSGLDVDIGLRVTGYLLLVVPLLFVCCLRSMTLGQVEGGAGIGLLWLVFIYAVILTVSQIPYLPEASISGGIFRQPSVRSLVQILMFFIQLSPIWIVAQVVKSGANVVSAGKAYLLSCLVLSVVGWWQLLVWYGTGVDPLPVGFIDGLLDGRASHRSGVFQFLGGTVYRMSSFGGEPRDLGISLTVALLLLQSGVKLGRRYALWLWPFLFVSMISTFSTMAIMGWVGASLVQFFIADRFARQTLLTRSWFNGSVRWILLAFPLVMVVALSGKGGHFLGMVEYRTLDRVSHSERGALEDFNIANLDFLLDQPVWAVTGTGLGNSHLYSTPYLPDWARYYAKGTPFVAKSSVLRWVTELGLPSLILFLCLIFSRIHRSLKRALLNGSTARTAGMLGRFAVPILALWLVSGYIAPQFYMTIGFCIALGGIGARGPGLHGGTPGPQEIGRHVPNTLVGAATAPIHRASILD